MKKLIYQLIISITFSLATTIAWANIDNDLSSYFKKLGISSNITSPHAYHGQQAGYYSGGSAYIRSQVRDVQLVQVDLPSYRSGCGGIDLYTGGFSFVNSDQLVSTFKNIMNNAQGYAFTLAMETVTPEISNVLNKMHTLANTINQANINSCEAAEGLVGGAWPKIRSAQQRVCEDVGTSTNLFSDWAQARQGCGSGGQFTEAMKRGKANLYFKNTIIDNGNIVWKAIQQNDFLQRDTQLAELFMSLSGTVVLQKNGSDDNASIKHKSFPAIVENDDMIKALLHGGNAKIYKCDTTDPNSCLNPKETLIPISADNAIAYKVATLLKDMVIHIYADTPLTPEEIGLLNSTSIPVYKMLNVESAFEKDKTILDVSSYADAIATDILFQYLEESLNIVRNSVAALPYPEEIIAEIQPNIDKEIAAIRKQQGNAYKQLATSLQMIQQTQTLERMLAGDLSTQLANTLSWAKGMH